MMHPSIFLYFVILITQVAFAQYSNVSCPTSYVSVAFRYLCCVGQEFILRLYFHLIRLGIKSTKLHVPLHPIWNPNAPIYYEALR